jgi:small subunit ribosomal protein S1
MDDELYDEDEMDQEGSFAEMLEQSMGTSTRLELGQQTEAKILQIGAEWAFLDIGQKGEGVLNVQELKDAEGNLTVAVGDKIKAYFMSRQGGRCASL